jgi:hypothetical protein
MAPNAFECWEKWRKACFVFDRPVLIRRGKDTMILVSSWGFVAAWMLSLLENQLLTARNCLFSSLNCCSSIEPILQDFLGGSRLWSKIERWLDSPQSQAIGPRIHSRTLVRGRHRRNDNRTAVQKDLWQMKVLAAGTRQQS